MLSTGNRCHGIQNTHGSHTQRYHIQLIVPQRQAVSRIPARGNPFFPVRAQATDGSVTGGSAATTQEKQSTFLDELRSYAMSLHTKEQAPSEGKAEQPKERPPWEPSKEGYLQFLLESREVYRAFESIMESGRVDYYKNFVDTGLERSSALDADIEYMQKNFNLPEQTTTHDGPGQTYAAFLEQISVDSPPAFICHYYNHYFAHSAGGRMIGAQVSKAALDNWMGDFYKWDGDIKELLNQVRKSINGIADTWTEEEKKRCIEETPNTFKYSGSLLGCISSPGIKKQS